MSGVSLPPPPPRGVRFNIRRLSWLVRTRMGRLVLVSYLALLGADALAMVGTNVPQPAPRLVRGGPLLLMNAVLAAWLIVALVFIYRVSRQLPHRWAAVPVALMVVCVGGYILTSVTGLALGPVAGTSVLAVSSTLLDGGAVLLLVGLVAAGISGMIHLYRTSGSNRL